MDPFSLCCSDDNKKNTCNCHIAVEYLQRRQRSCGEVMFSVVCVCVCVCVFRGVPHVTISHDATTAVITDQGVCVQGKVKV